MAARLQTTEAWTVPMVKGTVRSRRMLGGMEEPPTRWTKDTRGLMRGGLTPSFYRDLPIQSYTARVRGLE